MAVKSCSGCINLTAAPSRIGNSSVLTKHTTNVILGTLDTIQDAVPNGYILFLTYLLQAGSPGGDAAEEEAATQQEATVPATRLQEH